MRTLSSPTRLTHLTTAGMILGLILTCASCSKKESVDSTTSSAALTALGMDKNGENNLSWKSLDQDGANFTYNDVIFAPDGEDEPLHIDKLVLSGVALREGDVASFSEMSATGLSIEDENDTMRLGSFVLTDPNPYTASLASTILSNVANLNFEFKDLQFGALKATDFTVSTNERGKTSTISIDALAVEEFGTDTPSKASLTGFSVNAPAENISIALDELTFQGIDIALFYDLYQAGLSGDVDAVSTSSIMKMYEKPIELYLKGLSFDGAGVTVNSEQMSVVSEARKNLVIATSDVKPITITFNDTAGAGQMLRGLGYEELVFTAHSITELDADTDRISLKENHFTMKDGFVLKMDYELGEYFAAVAAQNAAMKAALSAADEEADTTERQLNSLMDGQKAMMETMTIHEFGLNFTDNGFTKRALDMAGSLQGATGERMAQQLTGMMLMATMTLQDDPQSKIMRTVIEAASEFIQDPKSLKIGIYPEEPISAAFMNTLSNPSGAKDIDFDSLGFVAEANGGK